MADEIVGLFFNVAYDAYDGCLLSSQNTGHTKNTTLLCF